MRMLKIAAVAVIGAGSVSVASAQDEEEKWDVAAPPSPTREIAIDVDEGTWMSVDVSPDGRTIAFDLLGDIYTMPIAGGEATAIASGMPWGNAAALLT